MLVPSNRTELMLVIVGVGATLSTVIVCSAEVLALSLSVAVSTMR